MSPDPEGPRRVILFLALACLAGAEPVPLVAQGAGLARIAPDSITELRAWDPGSTPC